MKNFDILYKYGVSPIETVKKLENGELYATSNGDIVKYNGEDFDTYLESPLMPVQGNTIENLTDVQLSLYWTLVKNS